MSQSVPKHQPPRPQTAPIGSKPFGIHVRVRSVLRTTQQYLFTGDDVDAGALVRLAESLCTLVAQAAFADFRVHRQLERSVPAVLRNVRLGFWRLASRAASDTAGILGYAAHHGFGPQGLCVKAANLALRIAEHCEAAARRVKHQARTAAYLEESERDIHVREWRKRHGLRVEADYDEYAQHMRETECARVERSEFRGGRHV